MSSEHLKDRLARLDQSLKELQRRRVAAEREVGVLKGEIDLLSRAREHLMQQLAELKENAT